MATLTTLGFSDYSIKLSQIPPVPGGETLRVEILNPSDETVLHTLDVNSTLPPEKIADDLVTYKLLGRINRILPNETDGSRTIRSLGPELLPVIIDKVESIFHMPEEFRSSGVFSLTSNFSGAQITFELLRFVNSKVEGKEVMHISLPTAVTAKPDDISRVADAVHEQVSSFFERVNNMSALGTQISADHRGERLTSQWTFLDQSRMPSDTRIREICNEAILSQVNPFAKTRILAAMGNDPVPAPPAPAVEAGIASAEG